MTPITAERSELNCKDSLCLACSLPAPRDVRKDGGGIGWLLGNLRRGKALYEIAICPEHHLYTAPKQTGLLETERPILVNGLKEKEPRCRHCREVFPEGTKKSELWAVAKLERWTETKVFTLSFPLCPVHTLTGGL